VACHRPTDVWWGDHSRSCLTLLAHANLHISLMTSFPIPEASGVSRRGTRVKQPESPEPLHGRHRAPASTTGCITTRKGKPIPDVLLLTKQKTRTGITQDKAANGYRYHRKRRGTFEHRILAFVRYSTYTEKNRNIIRRQRRT